MAAQRARDEAAAPERALMRARYAPGVFAACRPRYAERSCGAARCAGVMPMNLNDAPFHIAQNARRCDATRCRFHAIPISPLPSVFPLKQRPSSPEGGRIFFID